MSEMAPIFKKKALYACHFKTKGYLCKKERKIMAIEIKAIPTLEGKDAERFIERADEAERKFKGFDGIENTPAFKAMQSILRKSGMAK